MKNVLGRPFFVAGNSDDVQLHVGGRNGDTEAVSQLLIGHSLRRIRMMFIAVQTVESRIKLEVHPAFS